MTATNFALEWTLQVCWPRADAARCRWRLHRLFLS
jgi:hypothetical protein